MTMSVKCRKIGVFVYGGTYTEEFDSPRLHHSKANNDGRFGTFRKSSGQIWGKFENKKKALSLTAGEGKTEPEINICRGQYHNYTRRACDDPEPSRIIS